jgi:predicted phosphohydrolase
MQLLQVSSDIHFDYNDMTQKDFTKIIKKDAELLVLAGDIGNPFSCIYEDFIFYCSELFVHVFIVSGNHEYYNNCIDETDEKIKNICSKFENVHFLNNKTFDYEGITIVGTTLWSEIPEKIKPKDLYSMNDYKKIKVNKNEIFSIDVHRKLYKENLQFIEETLENKKNCIVVTHHAPTFKSIQNEYTGDITNCCFASNLDYLFLHPNLLGWVYGHTHHNYCETRDNYFLFCNCFRTANYNNQGCVL